MGMNEKELKQYRNILILLMIVINVLILPVMIANHGPGVYKEDIIQPHTGKPISFYEDGMKVVFFLGFQLVFWGFLFIPYFVDKYDLKHPEKFKKIQ